MTWLTEDPTPIYFGLIAVEAGLLVMFVRSGRVIFLGAMFVALVVAASLIFVERWIVTDRERVENVLYGVADALEANDEQAIVEYLSPTSPVLRQVAARYLDMVVFQEVKIGGTLKITINELTEPPSAKASFIGRIKADLKDGGAVHQNYVNKLHLRLVRIDDQWYIESYEEGSP